MRRRKMLKSCVSVFSLGVLSGCLGGGVEEGDPGNGGGEDYGRGEKTGGGGSNGSGNDGNTGDVNGSDSENLGNQGGNGNSSDRGGNESRDDGGGSEDRDITEEHNVEVTYKIGTGFAPKPWTKTLTVRDDGELVFEFDCDGDVTTKIQMLPETEHRNLEKKVLDSSVLEYKKRYECKDRCPTDIPSQRIIFTVDGEKREVVVEPESNPPKSLKNLLERVTGYLERFEKIECSP